MVEKRRIDDVGADEKTARNGNARREGITRMVDMILFVDEIIGGNSVQ